MTSQIHHLLAYLRCVAFSLARTTCEKGERERERVRERERESTIMTAEESFSAGSLST